MQDISNQIISMDKTYRTRDGQPVRILCTDIKSGGWPVAAVIDRGNEEDLGSFTKEGSYFSLHEPDGLDLIEVNPLQELKIDDKLLVRDQENEHWLRRYFAGISPSGKITTFTIGRTSWSGEFSDTCEWNLWKKAED